MRLNLGGNEEFDGGSGSPRLVDFVNVDARPLPGVHIVCDIRNLPDTMLGQVDEIRASHVIEHMTNPDAIEAVKRWALILKPGGLLRIYCPDSRLLAEDLVTGRIDIEEFSTLFFGAQTYDLNLHHAAYDQNRLIALVHHAGLRVVGRAPRPNAYRYDLGVQAIRPH